jgi:hypothetical protein
MTRYSPFASASPILQAFGFVRGKDSGTIVTLNPEGTFSWSAINSAGNASTFQGSYQFDGTTLILNRSNDNQKLAGALTFTSAGTFNFKLSDAQAGSLAFTRS